MKTNTLFVLVTSFIIAPAGQLLLADGYIVKNAGVAACFISGRYHTGQEVCPADPILEQILPGAFTANGNEKTIVTPMPPPHTGSTLYTLVSGIREQQHMINEQQQTIGQQQNRIRSLENELRQLKHMVEKLTGTR